MKRNLIVLPDGTKLYSGTGTQDAIQSVTVTESVNSGTELTLGSVCCSCLEATIINPGGGLMLNAGDVVQLYKFETDKDLQSLDRCEKVGTFLLEKPVRPTANTLKITAYDFISLLDKDLSDWLLSLDGWPYAVTDFAKMVCGVCGLQANEDTIDALPNGSHPIQKFAVSVTGRKLMEWVGQIGGRFCRADKDGYMEFAWYEPTDISIGSGDSYYMGGSLSYEDYTVSPIEKVQIRLTEDDAGVVAPDGDTAEKNTYIITGNYLLSDSSTAAIQPIAQSLYNQLRAVAYKPLKVTVPLDTGIRAGQIIQVIDRNGKKLPTYVMTAVQTGQRIELESTGSCRRDSTTVVNNESLRDLRGRVLTIQKSAEALRIENKELEGRCSALEMQVGSITMEVVNDKNGAAASIKISAGEKILVDSSSPRKAFANSAESAVEITGGTVAFNSDTLIVNSTNFTVDASGKITAKDAVLSGSMTAVSGGTKAVLSAGELAMHYNDKLYGFMSSINWGTDADDPKGVTLSMTSAAKFFSLGADITDSGKYTGVYVINLGVNPDGYSERHIFYESARFTGAVTFGAGISGTSADFSDKLSADWVNSNRISMTDSANNEKYYMYLGSGDVFYVGEANHNTYLFGSEVEVRNLIDPTLEHHAVPKKYVDTNFAPLISIGTYTDDIDSLDVPINSVAWITPNTVNNPRSGGYAVMETLGASNTTRVQRLTYYDSTKAMMERMYTNGKWYPWATKDCYDSIVSQGTSGIWTYRKWSSGLAECWCKRAYSVTTKASSAVTLELGDALPFAFTQNPIVHMSPTEETAYQHWFGAVHANTSQLAYAVVYAFAAKAVTGTAMVSVVGRWK